MSKKIAKKDWVSSFNLVGKAKISEDYTFKINAQSESSDWIYNSLNLGIDCGEKSGVVYAEMMGGYSAKGNSVIYAHGKDENGKDDFESNLEIAWDDRFDKDVLEEVGDLCFITVGIEKKEDGNTFYKKFLSQYDAIAYIKEHLKPDTILNVKGRLKYSLYKGGVQVRKEINSIVLSKVDDVSKFAARFTQSILLDKNSVGEPDKAKSIIPIYAKVLDYAKEIDGCEVKCQYPYNKTFEYEVDLNNKDLLKSIISKLFKVKKNVTQITFVGRFVEGGAVVQATLDDIPDDIKDLIALGVYTEEEALRECSDNGNKEKRMVLVKPLIKKVGDDENKTAVIQKFEDRYKEEDLVVELEKKEEESSKPKSKPKEDDDEPPFDEDDDDLGWLDSI